MTNGEMQGSKNPYLDAETQSLFDLGDSVRARRTYLTQQIEQYQTKATDMVRSKDQFNHGEWQQYYEVLEYLHDELDRLPAEDADVFDGVESIESLDQLTDLYADDSALFPRLGEKAVAQAYALLEGYPVVSEVLLGSGDEVIGNAISTMPVHRQGAFMAPDVLRGPVIFDIDGELRHIKNALAIRKDVRAVND